MKRIINIMICLILLSLSGCIFINPTNLDFGTDETTKTFTLTVIGDVGWSINYSESWLMVEPDSGQGTTTINVTVNRTGLEDGSYEATLIISTNPNVPCPDVIVKMTVGHGTTTSTTTTLSTSTTTINPCPPDEPVLCIDEDYDINQYWCCEEEYPVCGKVEYVNGEPQGTCFPDGTSTSTTIPETTTTIEVPPDKTTLYLSMDSETDLLFYTQHPDGSKVYYHGFNSGSGMDLTHVSFDDGSAIIFNEDLTPVQWIMDDVTVVVYLTESDATFDPHNAYHEIAAGSETGSYTIDIYPDDLSGIVAEMETKTGQDFSNASTFLTTYGISSFNDLLTRARQSDSEQARFIAAAVGFSACAAYLAMDATESAGLTAGQFMIGFPLNIIPQACGSLLASAVNDTFGPGSPNDPDVPAVDVLLCRGVSSYIICHYMFFKRPGLEVGPCIDLCLTSMRCFTDICMPKTISADVAKNSRDNYFGG
ncbi:MAG: BACON domain-containing protein [Deltaproteobacteria bacterium]|nr:BACON domain-containing protein [Deltaproteobacteria bacterium]